MEQDQLKTLWNKMDVSDTPKISPEKQRQLHHPLERIRRNMRYEFWASVISAPFMTIIIGFLPLSFRIIFYMEIILLSTIVISAFYHSKFFKLYKELNSPLLKTLDSLKDLLHQFELNKQYYISYYLAFVPFFFGQLIISAEFLTKTFQINNLFFALIFLSFLIVLLFVFYVIGKCSFKNAYGKYIIKIQNLVDEMKKDNF